MFVKRYIYSKGVMKVAREDLVATIVKLDKQGRINLGCFLRDGVDMLAIKYAIDANLIYIFPPENDDNAFFLYPTIKVDNKKRIIIPSWMRRYLDSQKFGIAFDKDKLVLIPFYD